MSTFLISVGFKAIPCPHFPCVSMCGSWVTTRSLGGVTGTVSSWYANAARVCPAALGAQIGFPEHPIYLHHCIFPKRGSLSAVLAATL